MKLGIVGHGFVGSAVSHGFTKCNKFVVDPKYFSTNTIADLIEFKPDATFVAVPTPHESGYDGREPTSHLPVKDFDYEVVKKVIAKCDEHMTREQTLVLISK